MNNDDYWSDKDTKKHYTDMQEGINEIHRGYMALIRENEKFRLIRPTWMIDNEDRDLKDKMNRLLILGKVGV